MTNSNPTKVTPAADPKAGSGQVQGQPSTKQHEQAAPAAPQADAKAKPNSQQG